MAEPSYIVDCVKEMESLALDEYGFNLMRTYYDDETLWLAFAQDLEDEMDKGVASAPSSVADAIKRLDEKIVMRIHDDTDFSKQGPEGVSAAFQIMCLDEDDEDEEEDDEEEDEEEEEDDDDAPYSHEMGPGIIRSMCLMVDEGSMRSLKTTPYVIAVDAMLHTGADLGYPGFFKVAIDSLMPEFYAALGHFELDKVAASVDEDGIWRKMK